MLPVSGIFIVAVISRSRKSRLNNQITTLILLEGIDLQSAKLQSSEVAYMNLLVVETHPNIPADKLSAAAELVEKNKAHFDAPFLWIRTSTSI